MDETLLEGDNSQIERIAQLLWQAGDRTNTRDEVDGLTEQVSRLLWSVGEFWPAPDCLDCTLLRRPVQQNLGS
jgi:hypothetical protein